MRIHQLLNPLELTLKIITDECSQFIEESGGLPIYRTLPMNGQDVRKVKVRKKKSGGVNARFNEAFDGVHPQLRQRAILAHGTPMSEDMAYVFPIDGYKFMYNVEITDSASQYDEIFESVPDGVIPDMLKFNYVHTNLAEGISAGAEIVLYNVPHFYAVTWSDETTDALSALGAI